MLNYNKKKDCVIKGYSSVINDVEVTIHIWQDCQSVNARCYPHRKSANTVNQVYMWQRQIVFENMPWYVNVMREKISF